MAETTFSVTYDGPALEQGRMEVRELAPALMSLAELFREANTVLYPDAPDVSLEIRATGDGSFVVDLALVVPEVWRSFVQTFSADAVDALVNLKELILASGVGVFWLVRKINRRRIRAREEGDDGKIVFVLDDGTRIEVPSDTDRLYRTATVRRKARQVVAPLERDGIDRVELRASEEEISVEIAAEDVPAFDMESAEEPLLDQTREMIVAISQVTFVEGNKWRFSDGEHVFYADVNDKAFLASVDEGRESFRKGDMLRCVVHVEQFRTEESGLSTRYTVDRVIEHIPRRAPIEIPGIDPTAQD